MSEVWEGRSLPDCHSEPLGQVLPEDLLTERGQQAEVGEGGQEDGQPEGGPAEEVEDHHAQNGADRSDGVGGVEAFFGKEMIL